MKRSTAVLTTIIITFITCFVLGACSRGKIETVRFIVDNKPFLSVDVDGDINPPDVVREGYRVEGWFTDEELTSAYEPENIATYSAADNILLVYAKLVALKKYTVTYDVRGGDPIVKSTVYEGETAPTPTPTKTGCCFNGWFTDAELTTAFVDGTAVNGDITLYARWTLNEYTVQFDTNGGSAVEAVTVKHGNALAQPTAPTRENMIFTGWFKDKSCTQPYIFNAPVVGSAVLYAGWLEAEKHTVTLHYNNGAADVSVDVYDGQSVVTPADPYREHYTFSGWYTEDIDGVPFDFDTKITSDTDVYARWEPIYFNVSFVFNISGVSESDISVMSGEIPELPLIEHAGYDFADWYTDDAFTAIYTEQAISANTVLYGKLQLKTYLISFETNGAEKMDSITVTHGDTLSIPPEPDRYGYVFLGWYMDEQFAVSYDFTDVVTETFTLYAYWSAMEINTVTFYATGGYFDINGENHEAFSEDVNTGDCVNMPANPTKSGFSFTGWFIDRNADIKFDFAAPVIADTDIYAGWVKNVDGLNYILSECGGGYILSDCSSVAGTISIPSHYNGLEIIGIGEDAFADCEHLVTLQFNEYIATISERAFARANGITDLVLPQSVRVIESYAFGNMNNLQSVVIPDDVQTIGADILSGTGAYAATGKSFAGESWDKNWHGENEVIYDFKEKFAPGDAVTYALKTDGRAVAVKIYKESEIPSQVIGYNIYRVAVNALSHGEAINRLVIPETITEIGKGALCGADGLLSLTLPFLGESESGAETLKWLLGSTEPNNLKVINVKGGKIGDSAFENVKSVEKIILGVKIKEIGKRALRGCSNLVSLNLECATVVYVPKIIYPQEGASGEEIDEIDKQNKKNMILDEDSKVIVYVQGALAEEYLAHAYWKSFPVQITQ